MYNRINHWDETLHLLRGDSLHLISALKSQIMNYYSINCSFDLTLSGREMVVKFTLRVKELLKLIFWMFPVAAAGAGLFAGTHFSEALQWIMFLCHAALFVLFSVLRTLSLSPSVSLFCCTLLSLSSYFYPSHSFQDVLFSLPPYLYFSCSLSTSSSSCCSFRLSCCCHCWYSASLRCTVLYRVCVNLRWWGGGKKQRQSKG